MSVLRLLFFILIVRPLVRVILGMNVRHRERLAADGPVLVVANHNSHLDTLVLMSLFPLRRLPRIHPVAAAEYFLRNRLLAWFARDLIGIIPIDRRARLRAGDLFAGVTDSLDRGEVVILFPEGSRGDPERLGEFKTGIAHIAEAHPAVPVAPVFLHGLGKALPKGDWILVPFFCDVFIGEPFIWPGDRQGFMSELDSRMKALAAEGEFSSWE